MTEAPKQFTVDWIDGGRKPRSAPNPLYPEGVHLDSGERPACKVELPYMTHEHIGSYFVRCQHCGSNALITAASRPDDPKSIMLPCAKDGQP